jgi:hypothetical protein
MAMAFWATGLCHIPTQEGDRSSSRLLRAAKVTADPELARPHPVYRSNRVNDASPATIVASPVIWGRRPHGLSGARVPSARTPAVRWIRPRQVHLRQHTDPQNRLSITGSNGGSGRAGGDTELRKESRSGARQNACKQCPCGYRSRTQRPSRTATQMRSGSSKA